MCSQEVDVRVFRALICILYPISVPNIFLAIPLNLFRRIRRSLPCRKLLNEMEIYGFHFGNLENETIKYSLVDVLVAC